MITPGSNLINQKPQMSELLKEYLKNTKNAQQNPAVANAPAQPNQGQEGNSLQTGMQKPGQNSGQIPSNGPQGAIQSPPLVSKNTPVIQAGPTNDVVQISHQTPKTLVPGIPQNVQNAGRDNDSISIENSKQGRTKKAKIAAVSLASIVFLAVCSLFGKTKAGKNAVKHITSAASKGFEGSLKMLRNKMGNDKFDNTLRKFYDLRDNKAANLSAVMENIINGKDVLTRNVADKISGKNVDTSNMTGFKKKAFEIYRATIGKLGGLYHKLDEKTTKIYRDSSRKGTMSSYAHAKERADAFSNAASDLIEKLEKTGNKEQKYIINGKELTLRECIEILRTNLSNFNKDVSNLTSKTDIEKRIQEYDFLLAENIGGSNLTKLATDGFIEKMHGKKSELLTHSVAGNIVQKDKERYASHIKEAVDKITRNANTLLDENKQTVLDLRKTVGVDDIDVYNKFDELIKLFSDTSKTVYSGSTVPKNVQDEISSHVDDMISLLNKGGNKNSEKVIKGLNGIKQEFSGKINGGTTEEIMDVLSKVLDKESYNNLLKQHNSFETAIKTASNAEANDMLDKLRDINCGSAPTDFMTLIGSSAIFGVYAAQAENNDERVSLTLTTGAPLLGTIGTNLLCAIKNISGGKSMAVSLLAGAVIKKICGGLNKTYRSHRGLDENAKASVTTFDDYINPYKDKIENIIFVSPDGNQNQTSYNQTAS